MRLWFFNSDHGNSSELNSRVIPEVAVVDRVSWERLSDGRADKVVADTIEQ